MRPVSRSTQIGPLALVAATLVAGCQHQTMHRPDDVSFLFPGTGGPLKPEQTYGGRLPADVTIPARAVESSPLPEYPVAAEGAHARPITVAIRASVDATGRLVAVKPVVESFPPPSPIEEAFQSAVLAAIRRWEFVPGETRNLVWGTDGRGQNYWMIKRRSPADSVLELTFTFLPDGTVRWNEAEQS